MRNDEEFGLYRLIRKLKIIIQRGIPVDSEHRTPWMEVWKRLDEFQKNMRNSASRGIYPSEFVNFLNVDLAGFLLGIKPVLDGTYREENFGARIQKLLNGVPEDKNSDLKNDEKAKLFINDKIRIFPGYRFLALNHIITALSALREVLKGDDKTELDKLLSETVKQYKTVSDFLGFLKLPLIPNEKEQNHLNVLDETYQIFREKSDPSIHKIQDQKNELPDEKPEEPDPDAESFEEERQALLSYLDAENADYTKNMKMDAVIKDVREKLQEHFEKYHEIKNFKPSFRSKDKDQENFFDKIKNEIENEIKGVCDKIETEIKGELRNIEGVSENNSNDSLLSRLISSYDRKNAEKNIRDNKEKEKDLKCLEAVVAYLDTKEKEIYPALNPNRLGQLSELYNIQNEFSKTLRLGSILSDDILRNLSSSVMKLSNCMKQRIHHPFPDRVIEIAGSLKNRIDRKLLQVRAINILTRVGQDEAGHLRWMSSESEAPDDAGIWQDFFGSRFLIDAVKQNKKVLNTQFLVQAIHKMHSYGQGIIRQGVKKNDPKREEDGENFCDIAIDMAQVTSEYLRGEITEAILGKAIVELSQSQKAKSISHYSEWKVIVPEILLGVFLLGTVQLTRYIANRISPGYFKSACVFWNKPKRQDLMDEAVHLANNIVNHSGPSLKPGIKG